MKPSLIDRLVSQVSPQHGLQRAAARARLQLL